MGHHSKHKEKASSRKGTCRKGHVKKSTKVERCESSSSSGASSESWSSSCDDELVNALECETPCPPIKPPSAKCPSFCLAINREIGTLITKSGKYFLQNNVVFIGTGAAVTVEVSHVTIDLCHKTIAGRGDQNMDSLAICLAPGIRDIKIINGNIENFSPRGLVGNNLEKVTLENLCFRRNGTQMAVTSPSESAGFYLNNVRELKLRHVLARENYLSGGALSNISELTVEDSHFNHQLSGNLNDITPMSAIGLYLSGVNQNLRFKRSTFNDNVATLLGLGFLLESSGVQMPQTQSVVMEKCCANGNTASAANGARGIGYTLEWVDGLVMKNCIAHDNENAGSQPAPMPFLESVAVGLSLFGCRDVNLSWTHTNGSTGGASYAAGARIRLCQDVVVADCTALGNESGFGSAYGWFTGEDNIAVLPPIRYKFIRCVASNNTSTFTPPLPLPPAVSVGIELISADSCEIVDGQFCGHGELIVMGVNRIGAGIRLVEQTGMMALPTQFNEIKRNELVRNGSNGISDEVPMMSTGKNTNIFIANIAKFNGDMAQVTNFAGVAAPPNPIREWPASMPGFPMTTDNNGIVDPLDNISVF